MLNPTRITTAALLAALGLVATATSPTDAQPAANSAPSDPPAPAVDTETEAEDRPADSADSEDDNGLFADPDPDDGEDPPAPRVEGEDLPLDETIEVQANHATFRFHADGPGMLTLLAHAPGDRTRVQLTLKDAQGRTVPGGMVNGNANANNFGPRIVVDANGNPAGQLPGLAYLTVPLTEEGDYQIEMAVNGQTDGPTKIGGAWVGFEQLAEVPNAAPVVPVVPVPPPPPFDPTDVAEELASGESVQLGIDGDTHEGWVKLTADDAGTLVVVTNARRADVRLAVFADGQFGDPVQYVDNDRQGSDGREALMFHSDAGETWYVRVTARGAEHVPVNSTFIPDDLELSDPPDEDDDAGE